MNKLEITAHVGHAKYTTVLSTVYTVGASSIIVSYHPTQVRVNPICDGIIVARVQYSCDGIIVAWLHHPRQQSGLVCMTN